MKVKKLTLIISLFILVLIGLRFLWINHYSTADYPKVEKGIIDLRGVALEDNLVLTLDGEWDFFEGQFIAPELTEEQMESVGKTEIKVPGNWKSGLSNEENPIYGYGTYRLRILLDDRQKSLYTMKFNEIRSGATVFMNGEKVAESGRVAKTEGLAISDNQSFEATIESTDSEINLIIHVSNYESLPSAGIVKPIQFGLMDVMKKEQTVTFMMQFMSAVILFSHFIYALVIFFVFVRKKGLVYLAITFLCAAISVLLDDDKILWYLFPTISFEWATKLAYAVYASSVFFVLIFFKTILADYIPKKTILFRSFDLLSILYVLFITCLLLESPVMIYLFAIMMIFIPIIIPFVLFKVIAAGQSNAIYLLLATVSVASSAIWGAIKSVGALNLSYPYYPFDMILGVLFFAVYWFKRFFEATNERIEIEAAWLQAQIRPHFLFNTLNAIAALSEIDTNKMRALLDRFGDYLRASFATKNSSQTVSLEEELKLVRSYVYIEQERFGDRLHIEWMIERDIVVQVPPLSIQTIVENAINHGILKRFEGGMVRIQIREHQKYVEIIIEDDGVGIPEERLNQLLVDQHDGGHGIGLLNTDKRLKRLYGRGLEIESSPGLGTTVRFMIQKNTSV